MTGWVDAPDAVKAALPEIEAIQGFSTSFATTALAAAGDDESSVLLWLWELKVFNSLQASWNQKQVGSCVSFGNGRAVDDLIGGMAAMAVIDWPGFHVATEPIYGGSRVEVGGGAISGDGSVGAWAAKWLLQWGVLLRKKYGSIDLSEYSESRCREYGRRGCPDELEPEAKLYPVKGVVQIKTAAEAWKAIGSGYSIAVCSNRGFTTTLKEGFCDPSGSWGHCMEVRARVIAKRGGRVVKAFAIQNSWAGYLGGDRYYIDGLTGEKVELPEGCFLATFEVVDGMLAQDDSFAMSDQQGFPKKEPFRMIV
jgi:hypothetical protein